jgi:hypothetical protein
MMKPLFSNFYTDSNIRRIFCCIKKNITIDISFRAIFWAGFHNLPRRIFPLS